MTLRKKTRTSLRSILVLWFIVFSIVPLGLVSWYSLIKFQKAIETEQLLRLKANGREIDVIISDYYNELIKNRETFAGSPQFAYSLATLDLSTLKEIAKEWTNSSIVSELTIYNISGQQLFTADHNSNNVVSSKILTGKKKVVLNPKYLSHLQNKRDLGVVDQNLIGQIDLILFSKMLSRSGKTIGYSEQKLNLKEGFLTQIKNKLNLELMLLNDNRQIVASTINSENKDFKLLTKNKEKLSTTDNIIDIKSKNSSYGFIEYPLLWDQSILTFAIGTNKKDSQRVINNVKVAFTGLVSLVILFLIITILITTSYLLRPIRELIKGFSSFEKTDSLVQLKVKNNTEIGLLTTAFNEMSRKIFKARNDLKTKINELEKANTDLMEAQTQLVHSAKMTSLGQLVAGVAHELNNPIGFIYSNTSYLKSYSEDLIKIIEEIEKNPSNSEKIKQDYEFEYIKKDLPLLIKSCQDGAERTRDIVTGLRNFSRLDESQLKEINLHEAINTTLNLLQGEIKNRIKIHQQHENIPPVLCYASQINQVLMNILSNAVQAISGMGEIWINTIFIKATSAAPALVQISIQDNGRGIQPQILIKIF